MQDQDAIDRRELITRDAAEMQGLTYYFTGRPCIRGHIDYRFVSNGGCKSCLTRGKGRVASGNNVISILHVFARPPTLEERVELIKILQAWSDPALVAACEIIRKRDEAYKALNAELTAGKP